MNDPSANVSLSPSSKFFHTVLWGVAELPEVRDDLLWQSVSNNWWRTEKYRWGSPGSWLQRPAEKDFRFPWQPTTALPGDRWTVRTTTEDRQWSAAAVEDALCCPAAGLLLTKTHSDSQQSVKQPNILSLELGLKKYRNFRLISRIAEYDIKRSLNIINKVNTTTEIITEIWHNEVFVYCKVPVSICSNGTLCYSYAVCSVNN